MLHAYVEAVDVHWARENRLARVQSTVERMREDSLVNSGKRRSSSRGLLGRWVSQLCACLGCEGCRGQVGARVARGEQRRRGRESPCQPSALPFVYLLTKACAPYCGHVWGCLLVCACSCSSSCADGALARAAGLRGPRRHAVQRPTQSPLALLCSDVACKHPQQVFQMGSSQRRAPYAAFLTI